MAAGPSSLPLPITSLPYTIQQTIADHVDQSSLLSLQRVSKHFHALASRTIYGTLNFRLRNLYFDNFNRFTDALEVLTTSDYDYAQHVKQFFLDLQASEIDTQQQIIASRYHPKEDAQRVLNTLLLIFIRKAKSLETFEWCVPIELSAPVYSALGNIQSLNHVALSLDTQLVVNTPRLGPPPPGPPPPPGMAQSFHHPMVIHSSSQNQNWAPPPPPPKSKSSFGSKKNIPARQLSSFKGLKTIDIRGIDDLDSVAEISACIKSSSTTLKSLTLSISKHLTKQIRKSAEGPQAPPPPQHFDDDEALSDDYPATNPSEPSLTTKPADLKKLKTSLSSFLAVVFGQETADAESRKLDKSLKQTSNKILGVADSEIILLNKWKERMSGAIATSESRPETSEDAKMENKKMLNVLLRSIDHYIAVKKDTNRPPKPKQPSPKSKKTKKTKKSSTSHFPNTTYTAPTTTQFQDDDGNGTGFEAELAFNNLLLQKNAALGQYEAFKKLLSSMELTLASPQSGVGTPLEPIIFGNPQTVASSSMPPPPNISSPGPLISGVNLFTSSGIPDPSSQFDSIFSNAPLNTMPPIQQSLPPPKFPKPNDPPNPEQPYDDYFTSSSDDSGVESGDVPKHVQASPDEVGDEDDGLDIDVDMEHPDLLSGDDDVNNAEHTEELSGDDEVEDSSTKSKERDSSQGGSTGSQGTSTPANESKDEESDSAPRPDVGKSITNGDTGSNHLSSTKVDDGTSKNLLNGVGRQEPTADEIMKRYLLMKHGFSLENLTLYQTPLKPSVLGRALDLSCLKSLTLLSVGPQGAFWTLLSNQQKDGLQLQLHTIHTDDVSNAFLTFLSELPVLQNLYMLRRGQKDFDCTTSKIPANLEDIRTLALRKHAPHLKRLSIRSTDTKNDWDLDKKTIRLLATVAVELVELQAAIQSDHFHDFIRSLPKFKSLEAMNLYKLPSHMPPHTSTREVKRSVMDILDLVPKTKLRVLVMGNHNGQQLYKFKVKAKKESTRKSTTKDNGKGKGKGKAPANDSSSRDSEHAMSDIENEGSNVTAFIPNLTDIEQDFPSFVYQVRFGRVQF